MDFPTKQALFVSTSLLLFVLTPFALLAQGAPDSLSFQGFVTNDSGTPIDDPSIAMTFTLYRGGVSIWEEMHPGVAVDSGRFNVILGGITPLDTVAFNAPFELGIAVGGNPEMSPRTPLTAAAYAKALPGMYTFYRNRSGDATYNVVGGASHNSVGPGVVGATIGGGGGLIGGFVVPNEVNGDLGTVSGGSYNRANGDYSTVAGGGSNTAGGEGSHIGGGFGNTADGSSATVGGGSSNTASVSHSTIGGGQFNAAGGSHSVVSGGADNNATETYTTIGGGLENDASESYATVGGGQANLARASHATVGGGESNDANGSSATIAGGSNNATTGNGAAIGGGGSNSAAGSSSTVAGGANNSASGSWAAVGGGSNNAAAANLATVGGGLRNRALIHATVAGGIDNRANGQYSAIPGGIENRAEGEASFAAGHNAKAIHNGTFVWSDRSITTGNDSLVSTGPNQFLIRSAGGVGIGTDAPQEQLHITRPGLKSAIFLGGSSTPGPHGIVFDDETPADGVQLFFRTGPNRLVLEKSSGGTDVDGTDAFFYDRDDDNFAFAGTVRPMVDKTYSLGNGSFLWSEVFAANGMINSSDRRLKKNIRPTTYGIDDVMELRPVEFEWIEGDPDQSKLGLIAQETESVIPEVVVPPSGDEGHYGLRYADLVPVLISAIQEQQDVIESLSNRVAELETSVSP
jgi:hypothetical protein